MDTPVYDFARRYALSGTARCHMPGHKGSGPLGCEALDLTEIAGADALYEASGIIAESERNAAALFGSAATCYSAEGSSQCIRAMLALALMLWRERGGTGRPVILAARNAHKVFVLTAALLDFDIRWLWPEDETFSLCRCTVTERQVRTALAAMDRPPAAVYVTSPDYLGGMLDIAAIAGAAHSAGVPLLVDNAHGAYLRFLPQPLHPLELGADLCCDSAHKTLPVLTGGAYLHAGRNAPPELTAGIKDALALFGSTSPSYLILESLDLCNAALAGELPRRLEECAARLDKTRRLLRRRGWSVLETDPLKLTVSAAGSGWQGPELAQRLRAHGVECEYADPDFLVIMITPCNTESDFLRLESAFSATSPGSPLKPFLSPLTPPAVGCSVREAVFAPRETISAEEAAGRILAAPTVACPPAVPVVVSGEVIGPDALPLFRHYHIRRVEVIRPPRIQTAPLPERRSGKPQ